MLKPKNRNIPKLNWILLLLLALIFQQQTTALAASKIGSKCTKVGAISGTLTCAKKNGKLVWTSTPKLTDTILVSSTASYYLEDGNLPVNSSSKSGLRVEVNSLTNSICQISDSVLIPLSIGKCQVSFRTPGSSKYRASSRIENIVIKRRNQINFQPQSQYLLSANSETLPLNSTAGLPIEYLSETFSTCTVRGNIVEFKLAGFCVLNAVQVGDEFTDAVPKTSFTLKIVRSNQISFNIPTELALKLKTYLLTAVASSGLPVIYRSTSAEICSVSGSTLNLLKTGTCNVIASQPGDNVTLSAEEVSLKVTISGNRSTIDQPDSLTGFQIKPIYVVPSDGEDRQYDINGVIADSLTEGNSSLKVGIGYEFQIDSIGNDYDIQYFKSSLTKTFLQGSADVGTELMKEMKIAEKLGDNRKNYVFFIDVESFKNDTACGYAGMPGIYSVVAVGPSNSTGASCVGKSRQLNSYISHTWVHEVFHNLGVEHTTNDPCDLMRGSSTPYCNSNWTIDKDRNRYVGSTNQGVNVLSLRVWKGYTADQSLRASCEIMYSSVPRADGLRYAVCPTGSQVIGALTYCWSSIRSAELQVWRDGSWVSLGQGSVFNEPWGKYVDWKCRNTSYVAPWLELKVSTPGVQKYRWMINGSEGEQFNIIWQK